MESESGLCARCCRRRWLHDLLAVVAVLPSGCSGGKAEGPLACWQYLPCQKECVPWRLCWGHTAERRRGQEHPGSHLRVVALGSPALRFLGGHPAIASRSPGDSPARGDTSRESLQSLQLGPWPLWPLRGTVGPWMARSCPGRSTVGMDPGDCRGSHPHLGCLCRAVPSPGDVLWDEGAEQQWVLSS